MIISNLRLGSSFHALICRTHALDSGLLYNCFSLLDSSLLVRTPWPCPLSQQLQNSRVPSSGPSRVIEFYPTTYSERLVLVQLVEMKGPSALEANQIYREDAAF